MEISAHHYQIALVQRHAALEYLDLGAAAIGVDNLEELVPVHPHLLRAGHHQEADIDRKGRIERTNSYAVGVDAGFNELILPLRWKTLRFHSRGGKPTTRLQ